MSVRYRVKKITLSKNGDALEVPKYRLYDVWDRNLIGPTYTLEAGALKAMDRKNGEPT